MGAPPDHNKNNQHANSTYIATSDKVNDPTWYADSRASCHVTDDAGNLTHKTEYNGISSLTVGNGEKLNIANVGDAFYIHLTVKI